MNTKPSESSFDPIGEPSVLTDGYRDKSGQPLIMFDPAAHSTTPHGFRAKHIAESLARIEAGTHVLTARVTVNDETMVVLASEIGKAFEVLHGTPMPHTKFNAEIVYVAMPADEFAMLPDYQ